MRERWMDEALAMHGVPEPLTLVTADGHRVAATRFDAAAGTLRGHVVVAGATGVPQGFYRRFAEHASHRGFTTLTLDYRGVGRSRPSTLRGFQATFLDWARLDLAAAVEAMDGGTVPLFVVGHSFGGHAFGLLPNHRRVAALCTFGTGAGWHGWMPPTESARVLLSWNVILPPLTRWKGYAPFSLLGMGEDLPLDLYRQWKRWCTFPRYFFDDPTVADIASRFASVRVPILAANALDDRWALPRSRDAFMSGYTHAPVERLDIDPSEGIGPIGHMGYFRPKAQPLWDAALLWLDRHGSGTSAASGAPGGGHEVSMGALKVTAR